MPDQAGIELILSAPNVKPIMEAVIDDWKEINKQEKEATEQLQRFNSEAAEQQMRMKEISLGNQKIKDAMKELDGEKKKLIQTTNEQIDRDLFASEHQQKGIFGNIKAYFQQRGELNKLGISIDGVNDQLRKLDLRQQSISLSARRGNTAAIKEYNANEKAIKGLNGTLNQLIEKENDVNAKFEITKGKFSGLSKGYGLVKAGAAAAAAAIVIVGAVALAAIFAIGRQNDQVRNQFEKVGKLAGKVKTQLSDAFAPVAFTFGKLFEDILTKFSAFLEENGTNIFQWSAKVAGVIAGTFKYIGAAVDYTILFLRKFGAEMDVLVDTFRVGNKLIRGDLEGAGLAAGDLGASLAKLDTANANFDNRKDAYEEASKAAKETEASLLKLGEAFFKTRNLTDEQRKALEALRAEYKKLTADLNKQIEALNVKEAGPFAGVLLKAELAAREIEALGENAVSVAHKLGKNQEKINEIKNATLRLAKAVRDDAVKFLTDQAEDIIDQVNSKLEELRAKRAGGEDTLKFKNDIEAQFKEIQLFQQIQQTLIDNALNRGESVEVINGLVNDLQKANQLAIDLANTTALDFVGEKVIEVFERSKQEVDKRLAFIQDRSEKLRTSLESIGVGDSEIKRSIEFQIKVNNIDLAVAQEQIRQFEESFEIFKKTGVQGVVQTEAQIRVKIEGGPAAQISQIEPGDTSGKGVGGKKGTPFFTEGKELQESLDLAVGLSEIAFDTITSIALRSVDAQIEANELLIQSREDTVNNLRDQVELEATLKSLGIANDFQIRKKQLDDAIKLEEEAKAKQTELNAKQAKIQRQQNDLQTASSLTTAVANIISGWSTVPLVGSILGIAAAAGMLISFAAAKIQAGKAARAYKGSRRMGETFGMMAPGEGYDDTPGKDRGLTVVDSNGRVRGLVGGDEYLHKQSVSRKHRKGFDYLNENENKFSNFNLLAMLKAMEGSNIGPVFEVPEMSDVPRVDYKRITSKMEKYRETKIIINQTPAITKDDLKEAVREVIKEQTDTMIAYHESRPDIIPNEWLKDYTERTSKSSKKKKNV